MTSEVAKAIAASLPACDMEFDSDLISLCDIVITGVETDFQKSHFRVRLYDPEADGVTKPWAILQPLTSAGKGPRPVTLWASVVRTAVEDYLDSRLSRGMDLEAARLLVDGSYTDAVVADSILQFAIYGEEVFS